MFLKPVPISPIPELTQRVALAAFPKGNVYITMRDELGTIFQDAHFEELFPKRGQPAEMPWRLTLVTVMQFAENLSDLLLSQAIEGFELICEARRIRRPRSGLN